MTDSPVSPDSGSESTYREMIYGITGVDGKSQAHFYQLGVTKVDPEVPVEHNRLPPFPMFDEVFGDIYVCKFSHTTALKYRKRVPVLFINMWLFHDNTQYLLFQLFLYFNVEDQTLTNDEFLSNSLDGKFTIEVVIDDEVQQLDQKFDVFPGRREVLNKMVKLVKSEQMVNFIKEMADDQLKKVAKKREQLKKNSKLYDDILDPIMKL